MKSIPSSPVGKIHLSGSHSKLHLSSPHSKSHLPSLNSKTHLSGPGSNWQLPIPDSKLQLHRIDSNKLIGYLINFVINSSNLSATTNTADLETGRSTAKSRFSNFGLQDKIQHFSMKT